MTKVVIKLILFFASLCALTENPNTDNFIFILSCVFMIIWTICSLFKSAIDALNTEDTSYYRSDYGSVQYGKKNKKTTYRPYKTETSAESIKKINSKLIPSKNIVTIIETDKEINNKIKKIMPTTETNPTKTLNLLPIRDILRMDFTKDSKTVDDAFISESTILQTAKDTVSDTIVETEQVSTVDNKVEEVKKRTDVSIIMIKNDDTMDIDRIAVYKSIIDAFKDNKMSQSMTYSLLQSITAIDVFSDAITIYTNKLPLFNVKTITEDELIASMKKTLHDDNLAVEIIERKDVTIADYYLKITF